MERGVASSHNLVTSQISGLFATARRSIGQFTCPLGGAEIGGAAGARIPM